MTSRRWRVPPAVVWALITSGVMLFLDTVLWWTVTDPFTGMGVDFLTLVVYVVGLIWSVAYGIIRWKRDKRQAWLPAGVILATLTAIWFLPLRFLVIRLDFAINYNRRMEVVRLVEAGKLKPNVSYKGRLVHLPPQYAALSPGDGNIQVEHNGAQTTITFYTFLGILGHASGFMYKSDDSTPGAGDFEEERWESEKVGRHWFWTGA
jgi:hypothetical protein